MPDCYKATFKDLDPKYFDIYSATSLKDQSYTFTMILKVPDHEIKKMENPDKFGGETIEKGPQVAQSLAFD